LRTGVAIVSGKKYCRHNLPNKSLNDTNMADQSNLDWKCKKIDSIKEQAKISGKKY
jgi:hypothetical protein